MQQSSGKNKAGRPIMEPTGVMVHKGDQFVVSGTRKESKADAGDGIVFADGGEKYYFSGGDGLGVYVNFKDVKIVAPFVLDQEKNTYIVVEGDSLSSIAQRFYGSGDEAHYMAIFNANKNILKKPREIFPGQKLIIPKL